MGDKKLKINVNLKTGEYIFDNEDEVISMLMIDEGKSLSETMKKMEDELREEYGFSEEMISRADPILYEKLAIYDDKYGTSYVIRYLNVLAKEIEQQQGESSTEYQKRSSDIRAKALENAGIELDYTMATLREMKGMPILDKLKLIKMAKKQKENGATTSSEGKYIDAESAREVPEVKPMLTDSVKEDENQDSVETDVKADEPVIASDVSEEKEFDDSKMKMPGFLEKFLKAMMLDIDDDEEEIDEEPVVTADAEEGKDTEPVLTMDADEEGRDAEQVLTMDADEEDKDAKPILTIDEDKEDKKVEPVVATNTDKEPRGVEPKAKKAVSRRQRIQASKKAMRESKKMKNVYQQKISHSTKPSTFNPQPQKSKAQKTAEYKAKHTVQPKKEIECIEIRNGKMVGVDENRPSAIVKTFTIQVPKKENAVQRFTRKLKDKADSIRNKVPITKERFRKLAITGVVGVIATVAAVTIFPKISIATTTVPIETSFDSGIEIPVYDGVEQVISKGGEEKASKPELSSLISSEMKLESAYIRDTSVEDLSAKETTSRAGNSTIKETVTEDTKANTVEAKVEAVTAISRNEDSNEYLNSVRVGSRMTIDNGKYFETPEGTGKYGKFENHQGEAKIISKIGIATKDGYISISSDDLSLLELKQMYPDAKFSYHIVDEKGHTLGWLTSESFEQLADKQIDDGMDR